MSLVQKIHGPNAIIVVLTQRTYGHSARPHVWAEAMSLDLSET